MSLDEWRTAVEILGVVALFLTFVLGGAAVLIGKKVAKRDAAKLREFEERVAVANARAADALADAARANERTEELKRENITTQKIMRPRRIPMSVGDEPDVVSKYTALKRFKGTRCVIFVVPDMEAQALANDVANIVADAGWKPEVRTAALLSGIQIFSGPLDETPVADASAH
jgi:hypothetical protein